MAKLLLVDDDQEHSFEVRKWLERDSHVVDNVLDGKSALDYLNAINYDVIILDWKLPDTTGLELLKQLRAKGCSSAVLMLTGFGDLKHKVQGFESGADDYLAKPFDLPELALRVKALLRRPAADLSTCINSGKIKIDLTSLKVSKDGVPVRLSPREFNLLVKLARHPNVAMSSEAILESVWPTDSDATSDLVRKYIQRLRDKVDTPGKPSLIRTVHGHGYVWEPGQEA